MTIKNLKTAKAVINKYADSNLFAEKIVLTIISNTKTTQTIVFNFISDFITNRVLEKLKSRLSRTYANS